jgi:hypothetical protein
MSKVLQFGSNMFHSAKVIPNCTGTEPIPHRAEEPGPGPFHALFCRDALFLDYRLEKGMSLYEDERLWAKFTPNWVEIAPTYNFSLFTMDYQSQITQMG